MRDVAASIEVAAVHSMVHAAAVRASAAVHTPTAVAMRAAAASSANLNDQTVVQLRDGVSRSVDFDCFRLRGCETQQRCDRDPSADRSEIFS